MSKDTAAPAKPVEAKNKSTVKDLLMLVLAINWVLGALVIAFAFRRMQSDYKLLVITFLFGLFGYVTYVND
jgi:hypothetical protein